MQCFGRICFGGARSSPVGMGYQLYYVEGADSRIRLFTDASGGMGFGAWWGTQWLQYKWPETGSFRDLPITQKEVLPVVFACSVWGSQWSVQTVQAYCDNEAAVVVLNTGYSRDPQIMHLLRCLFFIKAHFQMEIKVSHIPGIENTQTDAISRDFLPGPGTQAQHQSVPVVSPPDRKSTRLDLATLSHTVQKLFSAGLAQSTVKSYRLCSNKYIKFCLDKGITSFPAEEKTVCCFIAALYVEGLAGSSVKSYLAAIRFSQIAMGLGDPHMSEWPRLSYVVRGFKKKVSGSRARIRLPITPHILQQLKVVWGKRKDTKDTCMLWAASCLCFFGFLRMGEAVVPLNSSYDPEVHLSAGDVKVDNRENPSFVEV